MGDTARVPGSWLQLGPGMVVAAIPGENQQTEDSSVPSLCCSAYQENKNMIRVEIQKKQFTEKKKLETLSVCKIFTYIGQHTKIPKHVNNNIGKLENYEYLEQCPLITSNTAKCQHDCTDMGGLKKGKGEGKGKNPCSYRNASLKITK